MRDSLLLGYVVSLLYVNDVNKDGISLLLLSLELLKVCKVSVFCVDIRSSSSYFHHQFSALCRPNADVGWDAYIEDGYNA